MISWPVKYKEKFGRKGHEINPFCAMRPEFFKKYKPLMEKDGLSFTIENFYKYCYLHNIDFDEDEVMDKTKVEGVRMEPPTKGKK